MILYEVTLQAEPQLAAAVEEYMRERHIPEIFATGCFRRIRFSLASADRFRTSYQADGQADLDRYLRDHAAHFRAEFLTRFPNGVTLTREPGCSGKSGPSGPALIPGAASYLSSDA